MTSIHPTAIIEDGATLGDDTEIGPYCIVGSQVKLGAGARLMSHVVIAGDTTIGVNAKIFPFASIGHIPQDLKYQGEASGLTIGDNVMIREHVTINPGTDGGGLMTRIGDNCLLMVGAHVAHDCQVGNGVILVNNATLAGHVEVGDFAILGGLSAVHQFVRIGRYSMIGGMSGVEHDVIPYGSVLGNRAYLSSLNLIGLKRRGVSREVIHDIRAAYRMLFGTEEGTLADRANKAVEAYGGNEPAMEIIQFIQFDSKRQICQPRSDDAA